MCEVCRLTPAGKDAERELRNAAAELRGVGLDPSNLPVTVDPRTVGGMKRPGLAPGQPTDSQVRLIRRFRRAQTDFKKVHDDYVKASK